MGIQGAPRGSLGLGHNSMGPFSLPGLHTVQGVSCCDLSNGATMDPTGTAMRAGISCPSCWDLGALQCPMRCWESKGIMVEQMKHYLGHTCLEGPPEYIRYGQEALEHKDGCGRGRAIPVGMGDLGMARSHSYPRQMRMPWMDVPPNPLPWEFHGEMIGIDDQSNESSAMR
ncbi:hypothetical protein DV515_00019652, partial [Chloebia gouldiae]